MLEIRPIMNSPTEEIFEFKSCCRIRAFDQNLEIHVTNRSDRTVAVPSYFDLRTKEGSERIETLMPHGQQRVAPGETIAFYCTMDDKKWKGAHQIVFYDSEGHPYLVDITHQDMENE